MSRLTYTQANEKDLYHRGIPLNTLITPDNGDILLTQDTLKNVANIISSREKRKFTPEGIKDLVNFIRELPKPHPRLTGKTLEEGQNIIASLYIERAKYPVNIPDTSIIEAHSRDIHELEKLNGPPRVSHQFGAVNVPEVIPKKNLDKLEFETLTVIKNFVEPHTLKKFITDITDKFLAFNDVSIYSIFIPVDSQNRLTSDTTPTEFKWNIHASGSAGQLGNIQLQNQIDNIIKIGIGSFWLPMSPVVGSYYNRIRMFIKEFQSQAITVSNFLNNTPNGVLQSFYHFEFEIEKSNNNFVLLNPINREYVFNTPFQKMDTITITFYTPFSIMTFAQDRGYYTVTYGNPTSFLLTGLINSTIPPTNTGLSTGDLVYVVNSNSGNSTIDNALNSPNGYYITKTSNLTFNIPVDSSILTGSETNILVYYGAQRFFFNLSVSTLPKSP